MVFQAVGVKDMYQNRSTTFGTSVDDKRNLGRGGFTKSTEDNYKFKVPQLYNVKILDFTSMVQVKPQFTMWWNILTMARRKSKCAK